MSTFTAVDLSRLPAPEVVETLDFEVIFAQMLAHLRLLDPQFDALAESDPTYKLLQVAAYREMNVRQRANDSVRAVMLAYAKGADLDHLGALLGVQRHQLDAGDPSQSIPPTYESDTDFRRRIQLAPEGFSVAGPEGAYIFHALNSHSDVLDASATSPSPGEVIVTVLSRQGDGSAAPALIETVAGALVDDAVRPLTDHVTVQGAEVVNYQIVARVYTYAGPDSALVLAESMRRLEAYIAGSHRLGRDVPLSGIYSVLHSEGVQRVEIDLPAADVVVDRTQATWCTLIDVAHGGVDE
ncbi:baseplate assembly protein [Pseudoxanthomonas wuyuanensis]|uniref:Phage-related baseplate assembly protein n=1 Tax=Pseudoxanthomonas wuyuanensis TaxID=1073196 RepID=A0A286D4U7_9GAMM|nr:baseplate J/gp47 family protein [Pseudoxanthomonas wuyuanensis]KAF1719805.1 baseplate assembly protein [Pseudoxanthomonas wuyuanensis]SOD53675.1 Phage-related baseplate assembly protein [Pseudoxanthomonas wuyuanensis]